MALPKMNNKMKLSAEQKNAKAGVFESAITLIMGEAGSGKTTVAMNAAYDLLSDKSNCIDKIIITRPVTQMELGLLPGTMEEKFTPWCAPMLEALKVQVHESIADNLMTAGKLEMLPFEYAKGVNFHNAVVIIDESQDCDEVNLRKILTRLCRGSKLILLASGQQIENKNSAMSTINKMMDLDFINAHELMQNHRDPIVPKLIKALGI